MRIRYYRNANGGLQAKARVFDQTEHVIDVAGVDREAITIVKRLASHGYSAYIVGGAVRDLLLGNRPKDFDIVTDALPNRIRKIFSNSRIIGRRFKLVHVYANRKIYEVSTFRSLSTGTIGNEYGTIDEDVQRRDFTVNALYYDPLASEVLDFLGGVDDLRSKRLKAIIPLDRIFREDPVRMVRGVKYAAVNHFLVSISLRFAIHRDAALLTEVSPSRLAEEFYKIIASGKSAAVIQALDKFGLLQYLLPEVYASIHGDKTFREAF
ncbi:MAG: polynucleotide adenylyltransferase PcnB, partial [Rectinema sp.]